MNVSIRFKPGQDPLTVKRRFHKLSSEFRKASIRSHRMAAIRGASFAKKIAPKDTGRLRSGIKVIKYKRQSTIQSYAKGPTGFPYNLWVNGNIETINIRGSGKRLRYADTNHTGTPGYMSATFVMLQKKFPRMVFGNINKAIRISIR